MFPEDSSWSCEQKQIIIFEKTNWIINFILPMFVIALLHSCGCYSKEKLSIRICQEER